MSLKRRNLLSKDFGIERIVKSIEEYIPRPGSPTPVLQTLPDNLLGEELTGRTAAHLNVLITSPSPERLTNRQDANSNGVSSNDPANLSMYASDESLIFDISRNRDLIPDRGAVRYDIPRPHERIASGLNPLIGVPRHNLPLNGSYRPDFFSDLRLLNYEPYPGGWYGMRTPNTDFSDARYWHTTSLSERMAVWCALEPTLSQYEEFTGEQISRTWLRCMANGYMAAYDQIHRAFSTWCFYELGYDHEWTQGGKVKHILFKLDRWYGTIYEYRFAPNLPNNQARQPTDERIIQNPDVGACRTCVQANRLCYGHRETSDNTCIPCVENKEPITCDKHIQRYL